MSFHKCHCHYIPPHVFDTLAKRGDDQARARARVTVHQAKVSRERRSSKLMEVPTFLAAGAPLRRRAKVGRKVYDSQNQWAQRVTLARAEKNPATGDQDVDDVFSFAGIVRDYFSKELGRQSIDNQGMELILNVHYGADYMNAFWDGDEMTFGDGDGNIFTSFARSLDVTAHELAHGVTQFTANLDYYSQSGALNEHFSDVFGAAITQHHLEQDAGQADWLVGNEIMGPTLYGEALRSMKAPGTAYNNTLMGRDPQPDHMDRYYAGPADNRGVHINSGIPNRAFYLVARDIGTPIATRIWYDALQQLWATATFNDAVDVLVDSARTMVKDGVAPQGTTQTVRLAFREVGLPI